MVTTLKKAGRRNKWYFPVTKVLVNELSNYTDYIPISNNTRNYLNGLVRDPSIIVLNKTYDVVLIVEISDRSNYFYNTEKLSKVYSTLFLKEYWVLSLEHRLITIYARDSDTNMFQVKGGSAYFDEFEWEDLDEWERSLNPQIMSSITYPDIKINLKNIFKIMPPRYEDPLLEL